MQSANARELDSIETQLLLEGIYQRYGYDFRDYAPASLARRIRVCMQKESLSTISALLDRVLHDRACMERFLLALSIGVTAMFRDPDFYRAFCNKVVPLLRTLPFIRIWHAGCASGEEVYSLAILLHEEGLYDKTKIYATDMNELLLQRAREGIVPLKTMQEYTDNYLHAGGKRSFSEYYTARYENAIFRPNLKKNLIWAAHNLVTDASFNEFHVILCRNVMIYFNKALQDRVHRLLYDSLMLQGVLGLGSKESLKFTPYEDRYEELASREKIYRRVK